MAVPTCHSTAPTRRVTAPADRIAEPVRRVGAIVALFLLLAACTGEKPAERRWKVVWSDDFTGAAGSRLSDRWTYSLGTGYRGGAPQWGTGEVETMTDNVANVRLDGAGHLLIVPMRTGDKWTSGRVETRRTDFAAPEGGAVRIEATLKMPDVSGVQAAGYWSAFWALGAPARPVGATNWPVIGEWDVMENVNGRDSVWHTLHCGVPVGGPCREPTGISSGELPCPGCRTAFHTFALVYDRSSDPEQLSWSVDGRTTFSLRSDQVEKTAWAAANHHGFFIILNVAIGGAFPAPFGGGPTPATRPGVPMLVDRVAVSTR
ncbi:glycoside hydrolase family 16 protein [Actinoplanes sp. N902-109]|uniref:glycoside hydrolase family 16 protein n=1 Tax=Actinoplanes sp. (strain N902-109) TaxID=649831 RepID=UPI000329673A|nr:glycoside hydrolase family 16 protein [Actinoplanes sp. N902-109]AGL17088.1 glucosidase [Actinoplanes sp. N902-109]